MKKWWGIGLIFISGMGYGAVDRIGSERFETNRSSVTTSADTNVVIATGAIIIREAVVTAGLTGTTLQLFDSTAPSAVVILTSGPVWQTVSTGTTFPYGSVYSRGLSYTKTGSAGVDIHWDYVVTPGIKP